MLIQSPLLLSVPYLSHGMSTRLGGVSKGPRASWNLATSGDSREALAENLRRFALAMGDYGPDDVQQVEQVHGVRVVDAPVPAATPADALVCRHPGRLVGVRTADCAPVLMVALDAAGRPEAVAAVHAGWRGAVGGILGAAVTHLVAQGAQARRLRAVVGPCIGLGAFEVGEEVVQAAEVALGGQAPRTRLGAAGRPHLDLPDLVRRLLEQAGLPSPQIEVMGLCTYDDPALFHSYRRDGADSGRQLSAIALRDADS